jgi:hypothetical protein
MFMFMCVSVWMALWPSLTQWRPRSNRMSPLLLDAFRRHVTPQLTSLDLTGIPAGWLPSSLPALRSLRISCPGVSCPGGKKGGASSPCEARRYPRQLTALMVSCFRARPCSLQQMLHGLSGAARAGLQLRSLSLNGRPDSLEAWILPEAAFKGLEATLESLVISTGKVRTVLV